MILIVSNQPQLVFPTFFVLVNVNTVFGFFFGPITRSRVFAQVSLTTSSGSDNEAETSSPKRKKPRLKPSASVPSADQSRKIKVRFRRSRMRSSQPLE